MRDPEERWSGVNAAAPTLNAFLDAELATHGLRPDSLALVGFSQGTMMALHVGLRRRPPPAAIVGFSGLLAGPEHLPDWPEGTPPPAVFLTHGHADDIIPAEALFQAAERLAATGVPAQWHLSVGIGHGIDAPAMDHAGQVLARRFGVRARPATAPGR